LIIIVLILSANNYVYSQEKNYALSYATSIGFVYGQALELVYPTNTAAKFLSELRWEMKPVFYVGQQLEFGRTNIMSAPGFFSSAAIKIGFSQDSGKHENRDWTSMHTDALTHFSSHTNRTREFYWLDVSAGISIPVRNFLYIKLFVNGSWMYFDFTGRNGHGVYPDGYISFEGMEVIRYRQNWMLAAAGLSIGTKIISPLTFELSFQISPLTYCYAIDNHYLRIPPRTFYDYTSGGLFLEPKGSVSFNIKRIDISLEAAYRHIENTKGVTYIKDKGSAPYKSTNKSGAGLSLMDISFLFKIRL